MPKRKIKPKRHHGFLYSGPVLRRNVGRRENLIASDVSQNQNKEMETNQQSNQSSTQVASHLQSPIPTENPIPSSIPIPITSPPQHPLPSSPPSPLQNLTPSPSLSLETQDSSIPQASPLVNNDLDTLLGNIYTFKNSPAAYSAAVQKYIDTNYSLSLHKQRRKKFRLVQFLI